MEALLRFRSQMQDCTPLRFRQIIKGDKELQRRVEELYKKYLPTFPTLNKGCSNCWEDAFILLMTQNINKLEKMKNTEYILKSGVVLRDVKKYNVELYTRNNITDEIAEMFLKRDGYNIRFFDKYPADWEDRVFGTPKNKEEEVVTDETETKDKTKKK